MKVAVMLLLAGSASAITLKKSINWVELPNCATTLAKTDVPLAEDLSNATWATCKIKNYPPPPKVIPKTEYIWTPRQVAIDEQKDHEHQVTHQIEGAYGPSGPKYALVGRANKWVELPNCKGEKGEVIL